MERPFERYVAIVFRLVGAVLAAALALNSLVDPLWYLGGNRLTGVNHTFNERLTKSNLYARDPRGYDCLVLGSSRVTLLDETAIAGRRCFNYSFAFGHIREFGPVADYVLRHTPGLELVVIGVDAFNFSREPLDVTLPPYVLEQQSPPSFLVTYLSFDALRLSFRALTGSDVGPRYYRSNFTCELLDASRRYAPPTYIDLSDRYGTLPVHPTNTVGPFDVDRSGEYRALRERFRGVPRVVGYVPPVSAHYLAHVQAHGNLDGYLDAILAVADLFDAYHDFSFPSPVTENLASTYDGSHYHVAVNQRIARVLAGEPLAGDFGADVRALPPEIYRARFRAGVERFVAAQGLTVVAKPPQPPSPARTAALLAP
jgi:hypothetical protein